MFCIAPLPHRPRGSWTTWSWHWCPNWQWVGFNPKQLSCWGSRLSANRDGSCHGCSCQSSSVIALICSSGSQLCSLPLLAAGRKTHRHAALAQPLPVATPSHGNPQLRNCRWFPVLGAWPRWEPGGTRCLSFQLLYPIPFALGSNITWEAICRSYTDATLCLLHF